MWTPAYQLPNRIVQKPTERIISLVRTVNDLYAMRSLGTERISVPESVFFDLYAHIHKEESGHILMLDADGNILSAKEKSSIGETPGDFIALQKLQAASEGYYQTVVNNQPITVFHYQVARTGWFVVQWLSMIFLEHAWINVSYQHVFVGCGRYAIPPRINSQNTPSTIICAGAIVEIVLFGRTHVMKSYELVAATIKGENPGRTPLYAWVKANLTDALTKEFGSVEAFEDHYAFDMAHLFGGPSPYDPQMLADLRNSGQEITPEVLLDCPMRPVNCSEDYQDARKDLAFYQKTRERFCYMQTPGIFECLNGVFGIEDHLCYMILYPEALKAVYQRQAEWNAQFAENMVALGMNMIHVSDDWGAQRGLLFSKGMWQDLIRPYHQIVCDRVKKTGAFLSLHSDGCVHEVMDDVIALGYDVVHPWQESAGMPYDLYLERYRNKLGILGGLCVQSTLGFGDYTRLEQEIRRVFQLLKHKRWMFCTTHYVQNHCSVEELVFAFDLAAKLARE